MKLNKISEASKRTEKHIINKQVNPIKLETISEANKHPTEIAELIDRLLHKKWVKGSRLSQLLKDDLKTPIAIMCYNYFGGLGEIEDFTPLLWLSEINRQITKMQQFGYPTIFANFRSIKVHNLPDIFLVWESNLESLLSRLIADTKSEISQTYENKVPYPLFNVRLFSVNSRIWEPETFEQVKTKLKPINDIYELQEILDVNQSFDYRSQEMTPEDYY